MHGNYRTPERQDERASRVKQVSAREAAAAQETYPEHGVQSHPNSIFPPPPFPFNLPYSTKAGSQVGTARPGRGTNLRTGSAGRSPCRLLADIPGVAHHLRGLAVKGSSQVSLKTSPKLHLENQRLLKQRLRLHSSGLVTAPHQPVRPVQDGEQPAVPSRAWRAPPRGGAGPPRAALIGQTGWLPTPPALPGSPRRLALSPPRTPDLSGCWTPGASPERLAVATTHCVLGKALLSE